MPAVLARLLTYKPTCRVWRKTRRGDPRIGDPWSGTEACAQAIAACLALAIQWSGEYTVNINPSLPTPCAGTCGDGGVVRGVRHTLR